MYFVQVGPVQSKVGVITVLKMVFKKGLFCIFAVYSCNAREKRIQKNCMKHSQQNQINAQSVWTDLFILSYKDSITLM